MGFVLMCDECRRYGSPPSNERDEGEVMNAVELQGDRGGRTFTICDPCLESVVVDLVRFSMGAQWRGLTVRRHSYHATPLTARGEVARFMRDGL